MIQCTSRQDNGIIHEQKSDGQDSKDRYKDTTNRMLTSVKEQYSDSIFSLFLNAERSFAGYRSFLLRLDPLHPRFLIRIDKNWSSQQQFFEKDLKFSIHY